MTVPVTVIRSINANQLPGNSATTLGWFDFTIPNGYSQGSGLQLILDVQVKLTGASNTLQDLTFVAAFAAQVNGGSVFMPPLGTAPHNSINAIAPGGPGETLAAGAVITCYCQNVDDGNGAFNYNLPKFPISATRRVWQIPIVGFSQANWNSLINPQTQNVGGATIIPGASFAGGTAGLGFLRQTVAGYGGMGPWAGGIAQQMSPLPSSGILNATGIPKHFAAYRTGDIISIGIYGLAAGANPGGTENHVQINSVKIQAGNVTTDIALETMKVGFGTDDWFPLLYGKQKIIDHVPATERAPGFFLETTFTPDVPPPPPQPAFIPLPHPAYADTPSLAFYPFQTKRG